MPSDRVLTTDELRRLQGRSNTQGAMRLAIHVGLLILSAALVAHASGWWLLPAMFLLGLVQVSLFAPAHETMHQTAFASRRANAVVGWLTACPSLLNWHFYTAYHLAHHRHTQVPGEDPELAVTRPDTLAAYALRLSAIPFWVLRLRVLVDCWRGDLRAYPYVSEVAAPSIIRSVRVMTVVMFGGAAGAALLFGWMTPFFY